MESTGASPVWARKTCSADRIQVLTVPGGLPIALAIGFREGLRGVGVTPAQTRVPWWRTLFANPVPAWVLAGIVIGAVPAFLVVRPERPVAPVQVASATAVPVLSLALSRGGGDRAVAVPHIRLGEARAALVISLEYASDPPVKSYRATLQNAEGKQLNSGRSADPRLGRHNRY